MEDILEQVRTAIDKHAIRKSPSVGSYADVGHACELWDDGEVTSTKAGDLYMQRRLHMIEFPMVANPLHVALVREAMKATGWTRGGQNGHVAIWVPGHKEADEIRNLLRQL